MQDARQITDVTALQERCITAERSLAILHQRVESLVARIEGLEGSPRQALQQELKEVLANIRAAQADAHRPGHSLEIRKDPVLGAKPPRPPRPGHGPQPQPNLLEVEDPVEQMDDADLACPCCGKRLLAWEGHTVDSEEIDVEVQAYKRRTKRRQVYRCQCGHMENAPLAPRVVVGGRYSNEFCLQVVVAKHCDFKPLSRQVITMARAGLVVTTQTLWDLEWALYQLLKELHERLRRYILSHGVVGADETRWPVLGTEMRNWTMWCMSVKFAVYFDIKEGRGAVQAEALLKGFSGTLMVDGYVVYECVAKAGLRIVLVFCWSHVRRHFLEAEKAFTTEVKQMLDLVQELFAIEKQARSREELAALRTGQSRDAIGRIKAFMMAQKAIPGSSLRGALEYTAKRWTGLTRFLDNPDIPLTNNETERGQRGPVNGRKDCQGSKSVRGTQVAALFYSLAETAKRCGLNPEAYLRLAMNEKLAGRPPPLPHEVMDHPELQLPRPVRPPKAPSS